MNTTYNAALVTKEKRKLIKNMVLDLLCACNVNELPVTFETILNLKNIILLNSDKAIEYGFIDFAHFDFDGKTVFLNNQCFIIYNLNHVRGRQRWTIAHEIGHVLLNHKEQNPTNEAESNYFAKELLEPIAVLANTGAVTVEQISKMCDVSKDAAQIRTKDLKRHLDYKSKYGLTKHDMAFLKQFGRNDTEIAAEIAPAV